MSGKEEGVNDEDIGIPMYFPEMDDNGDQYGNYITLYIYICTGNILNLICCKLPSTNTQ